MIEIDLILNIPYILLFHEIKTRFYFILKISFMYPLNTYICTILNSIFNWYQVSTTATVFQFLQLLCVYRVAIITEKYFCIFKVCKLLRKPMNNCVMKCNKIYLMSKYIQCV